MADKDPNVKRALAIMAKNKKKREAEAAAGQASANEAGVPANMMGYAGSKNERMRADVEQTRTDREGLERQNNALAQELLKKQQKKIKGY